MTSAVTYPVMRKCDHMSVAFAFQASGFRPVTLGSFSRGC